MTATNKSIIKSKTSVKDTVDTRVEVARGAVVSINVAGAVIGLWSCANLISGMVVSGGPVFLAKAWFGAVVGL